MKKLITSMLGLMFLAVTTTAFAQGTTPSTPATGGKKGTKVQKNAKNSPAGKKKMEKSQTQPGDDRPGTNAKK